MISTQTITNHYFRALVALLAALALTTSLLVASTARPAYASTTFTVNSTADTGAVTPDGTCNSCTLREAIQEANANGNPTEVDQINFNIPGTGVRTISPDSSLPVITEPVVINGYSQPGSSANTLARGTNAKLHTAQWYRRRHCWFRRADSVGLEQRGQGPSHQPLRRRIRHRYRPGGSRVPC